MKQFSNMFAIPLLFPIAMYALFQPTVDKLLATDVLSNFVLLVGIAGFGAMIWAANQFTRPKLLD
ncbi:MAG: hypothetical protein IMX00_11440 [Limnochordales bacterium]|nr:hypothetical protein [Limnochordales bacterium]